MADPESCKHVPDLLSSFVDTFVDFSVSGLFLPPNPNPRNPNNPNPRNPNHPPLQTRYPPQPRLIAVGDLHGDLHKCKQSLSLAGLISPSGDWSGGTSTVVQVGDVLDRGPDELKILYLLEKLKRQAALSGGSLITLHGNHELMNLSGDFRYITPESLLEFKNWAFWFRVGLNMKSRAGFGSEDPWEGVGLRFRGVKREYEEGVRDRIAALRPGGPISRRFLGENVTVLVVGEDVFVHGGLLPRHVEYGIERINEEVREWVRGERQNLWREIGRGRDSVVWLRRYSHEVAESCDCEALERVLGMVPGARRMIMGHTIQEDGINGACGNKAIRIDVGMSRGCGNGLPEVLEIERGVGLRVLSGGGDGSVKRVVRRRGREGLGLLLEEDRPKQVQVRT